ncbi:His-rich protein BRANT [Bradyrhizobium betae]|uniref:Acid-shock protein n=1 Tax=Bradyrhizobium betae TaxID=244734 RepID=A0A5P6PD73_9BRAD|nr:hypothetical protein [Bradyrhizobium betae]MCS3729742.1 type IV secretory pathway TrbL component [Bradyrhizobium betae]QFI76038.1 hypothetical protein F8237_28745 [Bradyrhizobium betae]
MLKTISAALLAASVIAAPAFAAEAGKTTTTAPVIKADQSQTKASTTAAKPDVAVKADTKAVDTKAADVKADAKMDTKAKAMNANAAVTPDQHKTVRTHRHHHKQVSVKKSLDAQPDVTKPVTSDKRS